MNISIIVAMDKNRGIGKNNDIPWYIPDDLKRFKSLTTGKTIIMGRKTWFSLPRRPLPKRTNIVLTSSERTNSFEGAIICVNIKEALEQMNPQQENFIIGGSSVYQDFLPYTDKLYLTKVHQAYEVDTYFPKIIEENWELISKEDFFDKKIPYTNIILKKKVYL